MPGFSATRLSENEASRSLRLGKTFHATGWKVGYAIAPPPLTRELRRVHQFCTFATATPLQSAIADYLHENPQHYLELPEFYRSKRDYFLTAMEGTPFRFAPGAGEPISSWPTTVRFRTCRMSSSRVG